MSALFNATALVVPFEKLRMTDVESVGGKNASLGEMISQLPQGVRVPTGFATTAHAFREFLAFEGLADRISANPEKRSIQGEGDRSRAEDLDMIKGVSGFQNQNTGYQAALQSYAQVQKLSLFNYIG